MNRKISILHPSRGRAEMAHDTRNKWMDRADGEIEYLLSLDWDDPKLSQYEGNQISNNNVSSVQAINKGARHLTGDIIIVVSDDINDPPFHWDTDLLKLIEGKSDFVLKTIDGIQGFIIVLPIMDRVYYSRTGYIYHPSYAHLWSDGEMSCVGWMLGRYISAEINFKHNHYTATKGTKKDVLNVRNDSTWKSGKKIFYDRARKNFDLPDHVIVNPFPFFAGYDKF